MWQFKTITSSIFKRRTVFIDNFIFRCFYRGCFWILVVGSMLLCTRQYFGEHIHCIADKSLKNVINTYCFFSTTFTVVKHHGSKYAAHPGVGPVEDDDQVIHHAYYQWVPFFLFGQAIMFYVPHWIWKIKERKRVAKWAEKPIAKEDVSERLFVYRDWARWLVFCEALNFLNLYLQVYFTDIFLQGKFLDLGFHSDLETVFPKVTKCTWRQYGKSGTIQKHDAMCVIGLNVINEKIFIVLWYWYILLAVLSFSALLWRLLTLLLHNNYTFNASVFSTVGAGARLKSSQAKRIAQYTVFSEWLLVYYLSKNMSLKNFMTVTAGLGPQIEEKMKSETDINHIDKSDDVVKNGYPTLPSAPETSKLTTIDEESDC